MNEVSKELNSILNDEKNFDKKEKSPVLFITLIIFFITLIFFSVLFFNQEEERNNETGYKKEVISKKVNNNTKIKKILKEEKTLKIQEVKKEQIIPTTKIDKNNFYKIYNSNTMKILKCYNYKAGDFNPTQSCIKDLKLFTKENAEALRFQVIAVIGNNDLASYKNFKQNIQDLLLNGLSIKRISEITWNVKKELGNDIIVTSNNYYVESKKNNQGIIIRAYY